jgi:hypothetical protein
MNFTNIWDDRLIAKTFSLGDHLMAVIMVLGGNFGRNTPSPVEFPVNFGRTVSPAEFGSICPAKFGITLDSLSERTVCCPEF